MTLERALHTAQANRRVHAEPYEGYHAEVDRHIAEIKKALARLEPTTDRVADIVARGKEWSAATFGPGARTEGTLKHIAMELEEIRARPLDVMEWIDVILLALDGAWRAGHSPEKIAQALHDKQSINMARKWPPQWLPDLPVEHIREVTK